MESLFRKLRQNFRKKRYNQIRQTMDLEKDHRFILDLGGGPASFFAERFPQTDKVVLIEINPALAQIAKDKMPALHVIIADGERLPFANQALGLTVCNSVIEHVSHPDALAAEIQRTSRTYFLQTPNGRFPLETHSLIGIPFYNWLPSKRLKKLICKLFGANFEYVSSVRYIPEQKLRSLFANATLTYEKFLGLKKSFYVIHK